MRTFFIYIAILALGLASCQSTKWASADNYPDDLYYNPNDKPLTVSDEFLPVYSDKELKKDNNKDTRKKQGDYLKDNPNYALEQVTADLNGVQQSYANILTNDSIENADSVLYYNDETGYWVDDFEGSQMDLDYATRLIKFHGPFVGIPYWSPLYTDIIFSNPWDWNVYVDNNYAYAFPTYSNPLYWNSGFNMGFGWGMGFGGYLGIGYGYPYYGYMDPWYIRPYPYWYYPYRPWNFPYYPPYGPYCPPAYSPGTGYADNYYYGSRRGVPSTGTISSNEGTGISGPRSAISNPTKGSIASATTTRHITSDNNYQIRKGNKVYTRMSRSNQSQSDITKKSGSTNSRSAATPGNVRTTRRSYSSYSPSRSAKRSTFNRSSTYSRPTSVSTRRSATPAKARTSRVYSAPRRRSSYSTPRVRTGSAKRPTYNTGSSRSRSSSSTYSPSYSTGSSRSSTRSSSSSSSYSSSPSRVSRSSSSSFSPSSTSGSSRGSIRSSGGGGSTTRGRR